MAVTLSSFDRQLRAGTFQSLATYTQSTSTTPQALNIRADVHQLGMGTATGAAVRNLYTLADGVEGQEVVIVCDATGEASVIFTQRSGRLPLSISMIAGVSTATGAVDSLFASATGQYVFQASGEYMWMKFMNTVWEILAMRGATLATTT